MNLQFFTLDGLPSVEKIDITGWRDGLLWEVDEYEGQFLDYYR